MPVFEQALQRADWLVGDYSLADVAFAHHLGFLVLARIAHPYSLSDR